MSNKYLIFDVETTGLPIEWEASVYDVDNWPRVVQIAWQLYDDDKKLLKEYNFIIKPDGYVIPNQASHIHNITTAKAIPRFLILCFLMSFESIVSPGESVPPSNI